MNFSRSTRKAFSLATLAVISAIGVSSCVVPVNDYYPEEHTTVVVKRPVPVVQRVVYEPVPTVIVTRPRPYSHHYYYHSPRPTRPIVIHKRPHYQGDHTVILNPGRHQQQEVIVKPYSHHRPHNNETHQVLSTSSTEMKQPKKIVIESAQ